jgi:membrane protease YdiL (CAAX protease family)
MQAILIITNLVCYLMLLFQYRKTSNKGAKDLAEALANNSLQLMNSRTLTTVPLMILSIAFYKVAGHRDFLGLVWSKDSGMLTVSSLFLSLIISVVSSHYSKTVANSIIFLKQKVIYFSIRIPGLVAYEIFFRGVLLGVALEYFSMPVAILSNTVLYALAHAFATRKEFIGSIPFGLLLCSITLLNGSVYPSVLLHLFLALPYESILFSKCQLLTKKALL